MIKLHLAAGLIAACTMGWSASVQAGQDKEMPSARLTAPEQLYVCPMGMMGGDFKQPGFCPDSPALELVKKNASMRVAVLIFDGAELIDFAGPMEAFGADGNSVFTVGPTMAAVQTTFGPTLQPDYDLEHAPQADVLVIPGGSLTAATRNPKVMAWIRQRSSEVDNVMSVCTGAFILGKAGLLDGVSATSTSTALDQFASAFPKTKVIRNQRFVDSGKVITTGGLSSGIDGALHLIERRFGRIRAQDAARYMEYEWNPRNKGFAALARAKLPSVASILPTSVSWERVFDEGDYEQWMVRGHVRMLESSKVFLERSVAKAKVNEWTLQKAEKRSRSFVKTIDGQTWMLTIALANEAEASSYQLSMSIRKTTAGKGTETTS